MRAIRYLAAVLTAGLAFSYLWDAFVLMELNPARWGESERESALWSGLFVAGIIHLFAPTRR